MSTPAARLSCEKCGSDDVLTRWHVADEYRKYGRGCSLVREHLHYHCRNCQFDWTGPVAARVLAGKEKDA